MTGLMSDVDDVNEPDPSTAPGKSYWKIDPEEPFGTLMALAGAYCHPEADEDAYNALQRLVKRTDRPDVRQFRAELRDALVDPSLLPDGELFETAKYSDGSDERFLQRLWRDLYPEEPMPQRSAHSE